MPSVCEVSRDVVSRVGPPQILRATGTQGFRHLQTLSDNSPAPKYVSYRAAPLAFLRRSCLHVVAREEVARAEARPQVCYASRMRLSTAESGKALLSDTR